MDRDKSTMSGLNGAELTAHRALWTDRVPVRWLGAVIPAKHTTGLR